MNWTAYMLFLNCVILMIQNAWLTEFRGAGMFFKRVAIKGGPTRKLGANGLKATKKSAFQKGREGLRPSCSGTPDWISIYTNASFLQKYFYCIGKLAKLYNNVALSFVFLFVRYMHVVVSISLMLEFYMANVRICVLFIRKWHLIYFHWKYLMPFFVLSRKTYFILFQKQHLQ